MVLSRQIAECIIRPALKELGLYSVAAELLVLGTAAHESGGFQYLKQVNGPALSWWQIEPATHADLWQRTVPRIEASNPPVAAALWGMVRRRHAGTPTADELVVNPYYAAAVCRLLYFRAPEPLPAADDLNGMAGLWKRRYNTPLGKGRPDDWISAYHRFCT